MYSALVAINISMRWVENHRRIQSKTYDDDDGDGHFAIHWVQHYHLFRFAFVGLHVDYFIIIIRSSFFWSLPFGQFHRWTYCCFVWQIKTPTHSFHQWEWHAVRLLRYDIFLNQIIFIIMSCCCCCCCCVAYNFSCLGERIVQFAQEQNARMERETKYYARRTQ